MTYIDPGQKSMCLRTLTMAEEAFSHGVKLLDDGEDYAVIFPVVKTARENLEFAYQVAMSTPELRAEMLALVQQNQTFEAKSAAFHALFADWERQQTLLPKSEVECLCYAGLVTYIARYADMQKLKIE